MKFDFIKSCYLACIIWQIWPANACAQQTYTSGYRLTLREAIEKASANNKQIMAAGLEKLASDEDFNDARAASLPSITASGGYQRFTKLTLFERGFSEHRTIPKLPGPDGADGTLAASFILYAGGRNKAFIHEQLHKSVLAHENFREILGSISLQVASAYLDICRLSEQKKLVLDQVNRARTRFKNIESLYRNQKVTRSDLLRADLNLSNAELNFRQTENDHFISCKKLNVLLELEENSTIEATDSLGSDTLSAMQLNEFVSETSYHSYGFRKYQQNIIIQQAKIEGLKSSYYPSISIISAYGLNYPNTFFFPPINQAFSIGYIGFRLQYNLSSVYQNKHKVSASKVRLSALNLQRAAFTDNINQEAGALRIKYIESGIRVEVVRQQIVQAQVNFRIVSAKYFNQLALLTDLLDADNLLQESKYNLIQAQSARQLIAYRLKFLAGKL